MLCIDNKARHQNTKKKINAKGDTNVTADLGISCISDKVRTLRGFPECCFSPPKSGLRSLSTAGRGSEETPQGQCKQHVQGAGGVKKSFTPLRELNMELKLAGEKPARHV